MKHFKSVLLALLVLSLLSPACLKGDSKIKINNPDSPKGDILIVIADKDFRDEEVAVPVKVFNSAGYSVTIASPTKGKCVGMLGGKVESNLAIKDIKPENFGAVSVAGGIGSKKMLWDSKELQSAVKDFYKSGKTVGAICLSPVVLARAGLLKDKNSTVYGMEKAVSELKSHEAEYTGGKVEKSGRIVTARGPEFSKTYAQELLKVIKSVEKSSE